MRGCQPEDLPHSLQDRLGTDRDRDELAATFTLFQGDVLIYDNKSAKDMMVDLKLAAHRADSNPARHWVVVCVLTHGRRVDNVDQVLGSDGEGVDRKQIVNMFANAQLCPNLYKKPNVFIFQACRGNEAVDSQPFPPLGPQRGGQDRLQGRPCLKGLARDERLRHRQLQHRGLCGLQVHGGWQLLHQASLQGAAGQGSQGALGRYPRQCQQQGYGLQTYRALKSVSL